MKLKSISLFIVILLVTSSITYSQSWLSSTSIQCDVDTVNNLTINCNTIIDNTNLIIFNDQLIVFSLNSLEDRFIIDLIPYEYTEDYDTYLIDGMEGYVIVFNNLITIYYKDYLIKYYLDV